jgi:hypothetical protein
VTLTTRDEDGQQQAELKKTLQKVVKLCASWGWLVTATPSPLHPQEGVSVVLVQNDVWTSGPVWTGAQDITPTGVRTPNRPARSESLYRLRSPAD